MEKKKEQFRYFTTSIQLVELFCQTFFKTTSAPPEKPLHQRSRSQSYFSRSQSSTKRALRKTVFFVLPISVELGFN